MMVLKADAPGKAGPARPPACPGALVTCPVQAGGQRGQEGSTGSGAAPCASPRRDRGLRTWGRAETVLSHTYTDSPFSKLAVEGHLDFVLVSSPLIEGVAAVEGWAVQMQANSRLCVAYVLHTVQANGVYTSKDMK